MSNPFWWHFSMCLSSCSRVCFWVLFSREIITCIFFLYCCIFFFKVLEKPMIYLKSDTAIYSTNFLFVYKMPLKKIWPISWKAAFPTNEWRGSLYMCSLNLWSVLGWTELVSREKLKRVLKNWMAKINDILKIFMKVKFNVKYPSWQKNVL